MNCDFSCRIEEWLIQPSSALPPEIERHLEGCPDCQTLYEEGLLLNRLLSEPLGLPPADLSSRIMQAIRTESGQERDLGPAPPIAWSERLAWALLGSMLTLALSHLDGSLKLGEALLGWWESWSGRLSADLAAVGQIGSVFGWPSDWTLAGLVIALSTQMMVRQYLRREVRG